MVIFRGSDHLNASFVLDIGRKDSNMMKMLISLDEDKINREGKYDINKIAEKKDVSFYIPVFFSVTTFLIMNLFDYSFF